MVLATTVRTARDLDLAEECVQEAYAAALETWARNGVPDNPAAWLTTTASACRPGRQVAAPRPDAPRTAPRRHRDRGPVRAAARDRRQARYSLRRRRSADPPPGP